MKSFFSSLAEFLIPHLCISVARLNSAFGPSILNLDFGVVEGQVLNTKYVMAIGVGIIFLIFGLSSKFIGILIFRSAYRKTRDWQTVSGTVVGYKEQAVSVPVSDGRHQNRTSYLPQVQFVSVDGQTNTFYSATGSGRKPYPIGAAVGVIYPLDDPAKATIRSFSNLYLFPSVALFFGMAFTLLGLYQIFVK